MLLDIDGVLAPIVRHADDAHVPEPTRVPLIAVAKRYGLVACVSGRQAATARRIVSLGSITYVGNHGAEMLRGGSSEPELDPEVATWAPRIREFADARLDRRAAAPARPGRGQGRRSAPSTGAGPPTRTPPRRRCASIAERAEDDGLVTHWGRKVLEVRPPVELNKGRGVRRLHRGDADRTPRLYVGDDTTDLDAFAALRALVEEGSSSRRCASACAPTRRRRSSRRRPTCSSTGRAGVRDLLAALAA